MANFYSDISLNSAKISNFGLVADTTAGLPVSANVGEIRFDSTLNLAVYWNGTAWVYFGQDSELQAFSAWNAPQSNLNDGGLQTVVFYDAHFNTILGASMTNSIVTLPAGTYYISFSFVINPQVNNTQLGIGLDIDGDITGSKATSFDTDMYKTYTRLINHIVELSATGTVKVYAVNEGNDGTITAIDKSGTLDILRVS